MGFSQYFVPKPFIAFRMKLRTGCPRNKCGTSSTEIAQGRLFAKAHGPLSPFNFTMFLSGSLMFFFGEDLLEDGEAAY